VNVTIVNKLAILTTVQGSDASLKPLMLMSHFDVVPAPKETYSRWTYPPFSGAIDDEGKYVHGRGAGDCKNLMTAQYEALSLLLQSGFQPRRTIILAHGNDEETTGRNGARKLSPYIESIYGRDSILMIVDEGVENMKMFGQAWALPGTAEKGYLDVEVTVAVKGGHSSVPPRHTGIGIAADIIKVIEAHSQDQDFAPSFGKEDPILQFHVCAAENAKGYPKAWSKLVKKKNWNALAKKFADYEPEAKGAL
jgi:Gly-Xaa carboxypeptidase